MKNILLLMALFFATGVAAKSQKQSLEIKNTLPVMRKDAPVNVSLTHIPFTVRKAVVTIGGKEIPSQLDDLTGDGTPDALCFLVDIDKQQTLKADITYSDQGKQADYPARVYVDMMLTNKKIKEENKQDLYIDQLKVKRGVNPYWMLHHHGAAFESELAAYRIYFDHRQTVDIYGKYSKQLELKQTQFYPDNAQKAAGFGDDVLWVGNTLGVGALRGFDGEKPVMLEDLDHRGQRIVSEGPLRTIVEVLDDNWIPAPGQKAVTMRTYYTLYAGHRDCEISCVFSKQNDNKYCTGIINVKNSTEYSDHKGLRGCWGTDWPVSAKDSVGHKRETVGLGICIPRKNIIKELPADKDNYSFCVKPTQRSLNYYIVFGSDNESFGYHSAEQWFAYLQEWKKDIDNPLEVKVASTGAKKKK
ncbi:MAG: DUF4861 domain-containing protein [Bacteroidaceae bacterium]|nr:DUF4861 domain-containing protein [Bacteroidaceae bacterium]